MRALRHPARHAAGLQFADVISVDQRDGFGAQDACAVPLAAMQQDLQKPEIIARGRVKGAAAGIKFGLGREFEGCCCKDAVGLALMHGREPGALFRGRGKAGVVHAERPTDMLAQISVERFAAEGLDDAAHPIDVDPVFPPLAGLESKRLP